MAPNTAPPPAARRSGSEQNSDDLLAASLFLGRLDRLAELFASAYGRPPHVVWSPSARELRSEAFDAFLAYCLSLPSHAGLPLASAFVAEETPGPGWLMLVEIEGFGRDFVYRAYGQNIADCYGRDMQGRRATEFGGHISRFFIALYRAAMQRRQVVLSEHEPPLSVFVRLWRRLIVPLVDRRGFVTHFAVMNLPENHLRAGLEVIPFPCIVADADRVVRFANDAARRLVGATDRRDHGVALASFLKVELDLPESPAELLAPSPSQRRLRARLPFPEPGATEAEITVGATLYREAPLFVITLATG